MDSERLLTRRQIAELLTEEGFPTSKSTLDKKCSLGVGPPTEGIYGRVALHSPRRALEWARARLRPANAA